MTDDSGERKKAFEEAVPGGFFVEPGRPEALDEHLRRRGLLNDGEAIRSAAKAGEGNMNLTLRVVTS